MKRIPVDESARTKDQAPEARVEQVVVDVAYKRLALVNICFLGSPTAGPGGWVLIDAGIPAFASTIKRAAEERFGAEAPPAAIILTHAHFDHVGSLDKLLQFWDVPVYAHEREQCYIDGSTSYPPPDAGVGGGLMSHLAPLFPQSPVKVAQRRSLPADGTVPHMPGWKWIHVPGHTPGMIALWRGSDRTLLSADAIVTTSQESAYAVAPQRTEMHGPPMYFTQDWDAARESAKALARLDPELIVPGHGKALQGPVMRQALHELVVNFDAVARPHQ